MASSSYFQSLTFDQVLEDLSSRFIVNLPPEELESIERICFQIEQAHWYYEDFVRPQASHLPSLQLRKFSEIVFRTNPLLSDYDATEAYDHFLKYKERVPVCGAIIISAGWDKCLVVKGFKSGATWSFPRGKINHGENERDCAVREVWEETGYDVSPHFNPAVAPHNPDSTGPPPLLPPGSYPEDDWLEVMMREQRIRLYIVPGVPEDTLFETKTRKEISRIAWVPLTDLPTWSKKKAPRKDFKCYMVTPFVGPLKQWVNERKPGSSKKSTAPKTGSKRQGKMKELKPYFGEEEQEQAPHEAIAQEAEADYQEVEYDQNQYAIEDDGLAMDEYGHDQQEQHGVQRDGGDELAESSQALQALFFGNSPATGPSSRTAVSTAFDPSTTPATKSPQANSIATFAPPAANHGQQRPGQTATMASPEQGGPAPGAVPLLQLLFGQQNATSSAAVRASSDDRSDSLLRLLKGGTNTFSPPTGSSTSVMPSSNGTLGVAHPSRIPGEDPMAANGVTSGRVDGISNSAGNVYTEADRDAAREAIMFNLTSQLGGLWQPSQVPAVQTAASAHTLRDSNEVPYDSEEEEDEGSEDGGDRSLALQDLLAIFKEQIDGDGIGRQIGEMKLTNGVLKRLEDEQTAKQALLLGVVNPTTTSSGSASRLNLHRPSVNDDDADAARRALQEAMQRSRALQAAHGQQSGGGTSNIDFSAGHGSNGNAGSNKYTIDAAGQGQDYTALSQMHPQSRNQILEILQPNPKSPLQNGPLAQPLQQQASMDSLSKQNQQHKSQLLNLFGGVQAQSKLALEGQTSNPSQRDARYQQAELSAGESLGLQGYEPPLQQRRPLSVSQSGRPPLPIPPPFQQQANQEQRQGDTQQYPRPPLPRAQPASPQASAMQPPLQGLYPPEFKQQQQQQQQSPQQPHTAGLLSLFNAPATNPPSFSSGTEHHSLQDNPRANLLTLLKGSLAAGSTSHPPEFANGARLAEFNALRALDAQQNQQQHPVSQPQMPISPHAGTPRGDLLRLFGGAL